MPATFFCSILYCAFSCGEEGVRRRAANLAFSQPYRPGMLLALWLPLRRCWLRLALKTQTLSPKGGGRAGESIGINQ